MADLAARQYGVVARRQLLALGLSSDAIDWRLRTGRLHQLHSGVYAVGHPRIMGNGRLMAAVLAYQPVAVLSHRSAAGHWGLLADNRSTVDVTVTDRRGQRRPGIVLHRPRRLHPEDLAEHEGIPLTSVARTLLDVAAAVPSRLRRAFETAERLRLFDLGAVERVCDRNPRHRGSGRLRRLAAEASEPAATRSELEDMFLDLCRDHGIPMPVTNAIVEGREVDALWPDQKLIVELDSRGFHDTRAGFEEDRVRDAELQLAGYRVPRVTYRRMKTAPRAVAETVRGLLVSP